jgi:hypothetical protein
VQVGCECFAFVDAPRWVIAAGVGLSLSNVGPAAIPIRTPAEGVVDCAGRKVPARPAAAEPERPPQLQSLLIGPSGKYAIIDGQLVGVGDTFKDARVVQ